MKLSDFVAEFFAGLGTEVVFGVTGGASLHLIHSFSSHPKIKFIAPHHEQAAGMGADGYSRASGKLGVAVATSGPGATNLITSICCSFYDSIPVIYLTGQVSSFRQKGNTGVRQIGFQETPISELVEPITNAVLSVDEPKKIKQILQEAVFRATQGRNGPVVIDIPDDFQRCEVDDKEMHSFSPEKDKETSSELELQIDERIFSHLIGCKRPVVIGGQGLSLSKTEKNFIEFCEDFDLPIALTWSVANILPASHRLNIGTFGTHGVRHANFAVQNADLIISFGCRLDTKATGTPVSDFAPGAKIIMVDIDEHEVNKFNSLDREITDSICCDLSELFENMTKVETRFPKTNFSEWHQKISAWKIKFNQIDSENRDKIQGLNPYSFFSAFSAKLKRSDCVFLDTGCSLPWFMQSLASNESFDVYHDCNNTAMGWSIPAAIGGKIARPGDDVYCIIGDGSLMMTLSELATVKHQSLGLKILVVNNSGYSMIRQTQDQWLGSNYIGSAEGSSFLIPEVEKIASTFGLSFLKICANEDIPEALEKLMKHTADIIVELEVDKHTRVVPQVKFGYPNEDMEPLLERTVYESEMIIDRQ